MAGIEQPEITAFLFGMVVGMVVLAFLLGRNRGLLR